MVGNANALMQSEDWAALIDDAKSRKCFIDMESIPKEFLLLKGSATAPAKPTLNSTRSSRSGHRQRHLDVLPEPKSGTQSEEEDKPNHFPSRNGSYKNVKMNDASLDDIGHSIEKSKNPSQYSMSKRQNTSGSSK